MPERRESFSFGKNVAGGANGEMTRKVTKPGTVEYVSVRIYPGPETDLEIELLVDPTEGNTRELVETIGKDVIDGDDDTYEFHPSHPLEKDDNIMIRYTNQDSTNPFDFRVNVDVDYRGPLDRLASALRGVV